MPLYTFQHPETEEIIEVIQRMGDLHSYSDKKGVTWSRIFTKPQTALNTRISSTNPKEFVDKTRGKNYSVGQLWDMSAELSEKRAGRSGQDEVRVKAENKYEEKTKKKHPHAKKTTSILI